MHLYLAYGSNLHPLRLQQRLPGSTLLTRVCLPDHSLAFHKRGHDDSGKCNLIPAPGQLSYGALYRVDEGDWPALDLIEGGYERRRVEIEWQQRRLQAFTYVASASMIDDRQRPFDWYLQLVRLGADYLAFPPEAQAALSAIPCKADQDRQRQRYHRELLERLQGETLAGLIEDALLIRLDR